MIFHGHKDPFVSSENKEAFMREMERKKVKYTLVEFGGCLHAFTRPDKIHERDREQGRWCEHAHSVFKDDFSRTSPISTDLSIIVGLFYDKYAAEKSWSMMSSFLEEIFH